MAAQRRVDAEERRARLARRHRLHPEHRAATVEDAAEAMVALHATDAVGLYLSAWARVDGMRVADLERALYEDRTLVRHLAMRRTQFVVPRDLLPQVHAGATRRVAGSERRGLTRDVERAGLHPDGERWLDDAARAVVAHLADGGPATTAQLRTSVTELDGAIAHGEGTRWAGSQSVAARALTALWAAGHVVRAANDGPWRVSRATWATPETWLGAAIDGVDPDTGVAALVDRWLRRFGPGTEDDIVWWLGSTRTAVRRALAAVGAVEVDLDDGATGHLHPDDVEPEEAVEPWAALLPTLDPTTMGWTHRAWYLGLHREHLFDSVGNAGPTAWWGGRIVGGWTQDDDGDVVLLLLDDVGADARAALEARASDLTDWLAGARVLPRFPSPLAKARAQAAS